MAASNEAPPRRRRYMRQPQDGWFMLTPQKLALLTAVADYGIVSLPQLAALVGSSPKSARRHLWELFDHGLVEVVAVPRVALVEPARLPNDPSLLYGSAPNLYTPTRAGLKALHELGLLEEGGVRSERYGPRNGIYLAHELAIRDVRVWLDLSARAHADHELTTWQDGAAAAIDLGRSTPPRQVCPDAWFAYRAGERVLVGLLELDRGTERGGQRWKEKLAAYTVLYESGRLKEATGYKHARVLVVTPDARRRDQLAAFVAEHAPSGLASRFWLAERVILATPDVTHVGWWQPGSDLPKPLLVPEKGRSG